MDWTEATGVDRLGIEIEVNDKLIGGLKGWRDRVWGGTFAVVDIEMLMVWWSGQ